MCELSYRTVAFFKIAVFIIFLTVDSRVLATNSLLDYDLVNSWANQLSSKLWMFGEYVARRKEAQNSFVGAHVEERNGNKLVQDIAANLYDLLKTRKAALQAIVTEAEAIVEERMNKEAPWDFVYMGSKELDVRPTYFPVVSLPNLVVSEDPHFGNMKVNTSFSSVHVPTDVSDWANSSRKAAQWTENLDKVFIANYEKDRSLYWQYFGSTTGVMRHYPAMNWVEDDEITDIYDCRTRPWFTEASMNSMDMVIIVDMSGSMDMGYNKQIAWQMTSNLLDTLGNNDFVNVLMMHNDTVKYLVPCFSDVLVQANLLNVREFKNNLGKVKPWGLADFDTALNSSFELLQDFHKDNTGCHRAIMLISDGFYYNYFDIFKNFNLKHMPDLPVRVFTYLIGFKSDDKREGIWIACANRGYFFHVENEAEVRDKLLQYISVMARPLALYGDQHPFIWTSVYANIIDTLFNEYEWERKQAEAQINKIKDYRRNITVFQSRKAQIKRYNRTKKMQNDQFGKPKQYMLMTSVSMPAFNKSRDDPLLWNLLGVAGTDIPIDELKLLMMPHKLGVNGYAFIVTNNGYVLFHPDFRPVVQGILKPGYSTVDILELELLNDRRPPRDFDDELINFRNEILEQWNGSQWMEAKYHYDNMSRVSTITRQYYWSAIKDTVFSLVVVIPETYGRNRVVVGTHRDHRNGHNLDYFQDPRFRVHPEWLYCKDYKMNFPTPEEQLKYFIQRLKLRDKKNWSTTRRENGSILCDPALMQAVMFDAQNTQWFYQNLSKTTEEAKEINRLNILYGLVSVFISTHSGLTRWQTFLPEYGEFGHRHPLSIDEVWYHRAVEQCQKAPRSYVYSVELDAGEAIAEGGQSVLVTASHAIYHTSKSTSAPAAVVGYQFHHAGLHAAFVGVVAECDSPEMCERTCKSKNLRCFVLDNNAYILIAKSRKHTGKFFGEVVPKVMKQMIKEGIYEEINIPDYQGVCFDDPSDDSSARSILTPLIIVKNGLKYLLMYILWFFESFSQITIDAYNLKYMEEDVYDEEVTEEFIETTTVPVKTKKKKKTVAEKFKEEQDMLVKWTEMSKIDPYPCDREAILYRLLDFNFNAQKNLNSSETCNRPFIALPIPASNLLLVVVNNLCRMDDDTMSTKPVEVPYGDSLVCKRLEEKKFGRKPLPTCIKHHPNEERIRLCGDGAAVVKVSSSCLLFVFVFLISALKYSF